LFSKYFLFSLVSVALFIGFLLIRHSHQSLTLAPGSITQARLSHRCARVISFAPSVTELFVALHQEKALVGISKFDTTVGLEKLPRVGGYLDPSIELIHSLRPTLLAFSSEMTDVVRSFSTAPPIVRVNDTSISEIQESLRTIGRTCGSEEKAEEVIANLKRDEAVLSRSFQQVPRRRALVVVAREADDLSSVYVSGRDGYFTSLLSLVGIDNIYTRPTTAFTKIELEGLASFAPEMIIEFLDSPLSEERRRIVEASYEPLRRLLRRKEGVESVKVSVVYIPEALIPSPKYLLVARELGRLVGRFPLRRV
jgi:ABC-type Fe3+-hydroxamate transport system substrate-binding protein